MISIVGTASGSGSAITSPAETLVGDLILVSICHPAADADSPQGTVSPNIFTLINNGHITTELSGDNHWVYGAIAEDAGAQAYTFDVHNTGGDSASNRIKMLVVRSEDQIDWFWDETGAVIHFAGSTNEVTSGSFIQVDRANSLGVIFTITDPSRTCATPTGFIEQLDSGGDQIYTKFYPDIDPDIPDVTLTFSANTAASMYFVMIAPPEGGDPPAPAAFRDYCGSVNPDLG